MKLNQYGKIATFAAIGAILLLAPSAFADGCPLTAPDYQYYDGCTNPVLIANHGSTCWNTTYSYGNTAGAEWRITDMYFCQRIGNYCMDDEESLTVTYEKWCSGAWVPSSQSEFGNGCAC